MGNQRLCWIATNDIEHPRRQARVNERPRDRKAGGRRFLGRFDDHRASGRERPTQLACGQIGREIPRGERRHRPHRNPDHGLAQDRRGTRRNAAAREAAGFLGEKINDIGAQGDLAAHSGKLRTAAAAAASISAGPATGNSPNTVPVAGLRTGTAPAVVRSTH